MVSKNTDTDFRDEDRLVSLLKQGDEGAFRVLVRQYQDKTFQAFICLKMELPWRSNPIGKVRENLPFLKELANKKFVKKA